MVADGNLHSRIVLWLKVTLPLAALVLLSTLFLFAQRSAPADAIPFAELDRIAQQQQVSAPRLSGMTDDGAIVVIAADSARPEAGAIVVTQPRLSLTTPAADSLTIRAGEARMNTTDQQAALTGLARLETSTGYLMESSGLTVDLATGIVTSLGPLEVQAPFGTLTAGAVTIAASDDGTGQRLDFTQGVKLLYMPPNLVEKDRP